jgi:hypothetical protein
MKLKNSMRVAGYVFVGRFYIIEQFDKVLLNYLKGPQVVLWRFSVFRMGDVGPVSIGLM